MAGWSWKLIIWQLHVVPLKEPFFFWKIIYFRESEREQAHESESVHASGRVEGEGEEENLKQTSC